MAHETARILLAEDNQVVADVLRFNLEKAGFCVSVAHDGRRAVEQLERSCFDLIITDYQMPYLSGEELARHVRDDDRQAGVPIILCSAKGFEMDVDRLIDELRLEKVFVKPFSPREIVEAAKAAVAGDPVPA